MGGKKNKKKGGKKKGGKKGGKNAEPQIEIPKFEAGPKGYKPIIGGNPDKSVKIEGFSLYTPGGKDCLLDNTTLKFNQGVCYGLVGRNGSGKTTLLNAIGTYAVEEIPTFIRFLHVKQEQVIPESNVLKAVIDSDETAARMDEEEEKLLDIVEKGGEAAELADIRLQELYELKDALDTGEANKKASKILLGLGVTQAMQKQQVSELSGGYRMRVAIAAALYVEPDVLLLDEPTNHLDFPSVVWLQEYLMNYKKTVLLVSHDRVFLNDVVKWVIHLDKKKLTYYKGNYETFEKVRENHLREQEKKYNAYIIRRNEIVEYIEKFKDKGEKRAAQVLVRRKMLSELDKDAPEEPRPRKPFEFRFPEVSSIDKVVEFNDVDFRYNEKSRWIFQNLTFRLSTDSRIGVIGANGIGKTTLIKLMTGQLKPTESGDAEIDVNKYLTRNEQARMAKFTQHHTDQLDLNKNAIEFLHNMFKDEMKEKDQYQYVRRRLGRFALSGDHQTQKMKYLSGGEKSRVAFCVLTWRSPNFLIMDEPTNHLDLETIDALVDAVKEFNGGIFLVSHDQHFLQRACDEFWVVTPDGIKSFVDFEKAKAEALKRKISDGV